jgi:hypothetical protein
MTPFRTLATPAQRLAVLHIMQAAQWGRMYSVSCMKIGSAHSPSFNPQP